LEDQLLTRTLVISLLMAAGAVATIPLSSSFAGDQIKTVRPPESYVYGPTGVRANTCEADDEDNGCSFLFTGTITREKVDFVINTIATANSLNPRRNIMLDINSSGGSVQEAMRLGRALRKNQAMVHVWQQCASACVYVLSGAVRRIASDGSVFIHRPYGATAKKTNHRSTDQEWKQLQGQIRHYLLEMNIPESLLDAMNRVPPEESVALGPEELARYGLNRNDPAYEEALDSTAAATLGISRTKYLERKRRVAECRQAIRDTQERIGDRELLEESRFACDKLMEDSPMEALIRNAYKR
jgi:ATP-dependent protease ClpP protease subunit